MATRIAQQNLLVGEEASSAAFTPAGETIALTLTVTELVADSVARLVVVNDRGLIQASTVVFGTGAKKVTIGKLDGAITCRVEQLQGSGQISVADPTGGAVETADIADDAVTQAKIAAAAVDTTELAAGAATLPKVDFAGIKTLRFDGRNGAGAVTLTGAAIGDRVVSIFGVTTATSATVVALPGTDYEAAITVADQIQQVETGDLTGNDYVVLLAPALA